MGQMKSCGFGLALASESLHPQGYLCLLSLVESQPTASSKPHSTMTRPCQRQTYEGTFIKTQLNNNKVTVISRTSQEPTQRQSRAGAAWPGLSGNSLHPTCDAFSQGIFHQPWHVISQRSDRRKLGRELINSLLPISASPDG